ncbi:MAG TPA: hypothetical protein VHB72_02120 [Candidatus Saccharimonadales bacterium]|nr:hypothetical protein [Candidatus Saccharimonadales bacterium]
MSISTNIKRFLSTAAVSVLGIGLIAAPAAFAHGSTNNGSQHAQYAAQFSPGVDNHSNSWWSMWHKYNPGTPTLSCSQQQQILNTEATNNASADKKKLTGLNIMLSGVQTYVSSGNVSVNNYDTLNATATNDQTTATTDVNAIAAPQLNCDNESPSDYSNAQKQLSGEINTAKKALGTYGHDMMNLFQAVVNS